jgi:hypothetical protein
MLFNQNTAMEKVWKQYGFLLTSLIVYALAYVSLIDKDPSSPSGFVTERAYLGVVIPIIVTGFIQLCNLVFPGFIKYFIYLGIMWGAVLAVSEEVNSRTFTPAIPIVGVFEATCLVLFMYFTYKAFKNLFTNPKKENLSYWSRSLTALFTFAVIVTMLGTLLATGQW